MGEGAEVPGNCCRDWALSNGWGGGWGAGGAWGLGGSCSTGGTGGLCESWGLPKQFKGVGGARKEGGA